MKNNPHVSHQQFVSCLTNMDKTETSESIGKWKQEDTALGSLFDLIEDLRHHIDIHGDQKGHISLMSFSDIEEMLIRIVSGDYHHADAQKFVDNLKASSLSYERVLLKLRQIAFVTKPGEIPEMVDVQIKSNREILADYILRDASPQTRIKEQPSKSKLQKILEALQNFLFPPNPIPKYAVGITTFMALLIFIPNISGNLHKQGLFDQYLVSADYQGSTLRSGSSDLDYNGDQQNFVDGLELTMADFLTGNYRSAIDNFSSLEPAAKRLMTDPDHRLIATIRDYYFYYGYSHLAVAQPGVIDFNRSDEEHHLQETIRLLSNAKMIAQQHNLDNLDQESYFLALANGLGGDKKIAIEKLRKIKSGKYVRDAGKLIQEWDR